MTSSIYAIKNKNYFPRTILHILLSTLQLKVKPYKLMITKRNFVSNYWGVMMRLLRAGLHFYIIGLIILTLGIALTILSLLGTSPYDSLLVGLNRTFGFTVGTWEIVVGVSMFIFNSIAEKRR